MLQYDRHKDCTICFVLDIFCVKFKKHLLLGHAWLEDVDYVGL